MAGHIGHAEVETALMCWRRVGATAYIHEGEALLAEQRPPGQARPT
jgi:hypothetical protein